MLEMILKAYRDDAASGTTVYTWYTSYKEGWKLLETESRSSRPV